LPVRCFIAVEVNDPQVLKAFRLVQSRIASTGGDLKLVEVENIHLTLKFLGDVDESKLEDVKSIVSSIIFPRFLMEIDGVGVFPNIRRPRTIWAAITGGVQELSTIFNGLEAGLMDLGFRREGRIFSPHITLARVRGGRNRDKLAEEILDMRDQAFGGVQVDRIYLKKSVLTSQGPIYSNIVSSMV
jgi:2'-5' RNA ligase